jgi:transposase
LPPGVPTGAFGSRLRAILSVLAGGYRLGKPPIRQLALDLLGLSISIGMFCRLERQSADELETPVEELREYVRDAGVAHIDETSWWQGRDKMWLWAAVTRLVRVFTIAPTRGADVAKQVLGTDAKKVVISDRLSSYGWIKRRQFCWAHLNRDFQAMVDRGGESAEVGRLLLDHSVKLFDWWYRVRDGTMARATNSPRVAPTATNGKASQYDPPKRASTKSERTKATNPVMTARRMRQVHKFLACSFFNPLGESVRR